MPRPTMCETQPGVYHALDLNTIKMYSTEYPGGWRVAKVALPFPIRPDLHVMTNVLGKLNGVRVAFGGGEEQTSKVIGYETGDEVLVTYLRL